MFTIRAETIGDHKTIYEVTREAFKQENESKLINALRQSESFIPELSLVAEKDQEILGHILFSTISIESSVGSTPSLILSPMSVKTIYQLQGIGSALVREGLKRSRQLGYEHVVVFGHPNFYPKFGFIPANTKGIHPPFKVPDKVFMVKELCVGSLKYVNGIVKYPPEFKLV